MHSFQLNEDHLSQQHILWGRDKEITKIFTSQCCLPSTGTHRDISILVSSYSFLFHVGSNINYHYDLNKCLYSATHHFFVCLYFCFVFYYYYYYFVYKGALFILFPDFSSQ